MRRTENAELTVLCLVEDHGRILLQNRVKEDWQGYTLPGGHVEPGESFVDAVIREVKEETGLEIHNPHLVGVKQFPIENGRYIVLLYQTDTFSGQLVSSPEGEMKWFEMDHLEDVPTVEDFAELLQVMRSPDLSEFRYIIENGEWNVVLK